MHSQPCIALEKLAACVHVCYYAKGDAKYGDNTGDKKERTVSALSLERSSAFSTRSRSISLRSFVTSAWTIVRVCVCACACVGVFLCMCVVLLWDVAPLTATLINDARSRFNDAVRNNFAITLLLSGFRRALLPVCWINATSGTKDMFTVKFTPSCCDIESDCDVTGKHERVAHIQRMVWGGVRTSVGVTSPAAVAVSVPTAVPRQAIGMKGVRETRSRTPVCDMKRYTLMRSRSDCHRGALVIRADKIV